MGVANRAMSTSLLATAAAALLGCSAPPENSPVANVAPDNLVTQTDNGAMAAEPPPVRSQEKSSMADQRPASPATPPKAPPPAPVIKPSPIQPPAEVDPPHRDPGDRVPQ